MASRQLIQACLQNNRQAQQELYQLYGAAMLGICYRYTKSIEDAEDVLQEGFIKVFKNLQQFRNDGDIAAWIRRIMVNTAITYLHKHNRYKKEMVGEEDNNLHPVTDDNPEIHLHTKELIELIRTLPSGYQTIFNLAAIEGFEHTEIAALLQMNINTVRSQYKRARAMLIKKIEQQQNIIKNYEQKI